MNTKEYLRDVLELEKTLYTLNTAIGYLKKREKRLGIAANIEKPNQNLGADGIEMGAYRAVIVGGCGILFGLFVGFVEEGPFGFVYKEFWICVLISTVLFTIIGFIFGFIEGKCSYGDKKKAYEIEVARYNEIVRRDNLRVNNDLKKKKKIRAQILSLDNKRGEISIVLSKMYGLNVLYPKYRNLVAVATIYEYFDAGRCSTLQGHEGAYNIYETELRLNRIIAKLDDILRSLEEIKVNQYEIYKAVKEGNRIANAIYQQNVRIIENTDRMVENTEISAYYNKISAMNLTSINLKYTRNI